MASRGVIYIVWGDVEEALARSIASVKAFHPELGIEVVRLPAKAERLENLLEKSRMMSLSPFEETLFLDADTEVLGRLDYGYEQAARFGIACCISESPWARRYPALPQNDAVEYNTGVMFFTRAAESVFRRWEELSPQLDSSLPFVNPTGPAMVQVYNDQAAFAQAATEWDKAPFVLPHNWNFRPAFQWTFFGPIKIWHDYGPVPPALVQINHRYLKPETLIQFHGRAAAPASP